DKGNKTHTIPDSLRARNRATGLSYPAGYGTRQTRNVSGRFNFLTGELGAPPRMADDQCDDSPGAPVSGWISAAIMPLEPGPNRTSTYWPGRSSVIPKRRRVSMCTKMSGVPSPQVRKPNPRNRLNHLTWARSNPLVGVTLTWVRGGSICAG